MPPLQTALKSSTDTELIPEGGVCEVHIPCSIEPTHHDEMRVAVKVDRDDGTLQGKQVFKALPLVTCALEAAGFHEPLHVQEREAAAYLHFDRVGAAHHALGDELFRDWVIVGKGQDGGQCGGGATGFPFLDDDALVADLEQ